MFSWVSITRSKLISDSFYRNALNYGLNRVVYGVFNTFSGLIHWFQGPKL